MRDKDAQLMLEDYFGTRDASGADSLDYKKQAMADKDYMKPAAAQLGKDRRISNDDILNRVDRVMDNYVRSGSSPVYAGGILNDLQDLIDGDGDEDILRHYEGWGNQDLVEFQRALSRKFNM